MNQTRIFVFLYMAALRSLIKKPIKDPELDSPRWQELDKARRLVDEIGGDYADYIRVQFEAFRYARLGAYPKPEHLSSAKAIERYKGWQRRSNKYNGRTYTMDGDNFIVNSTGKSYPISILSLSSAEDSVASYAINATHRLNWIGIEEPIIEEEYNAVEYLCAKLEYKRKEPTMTLLRTRDDLRKIRVPF